MGGRETQFLPTGGKARGIYLQLRDDIAGGRVPAGAPLPGEQRLAASHGVSRVTIRRALEALAAEGLIEKRPGAGSIVTTAGAGKSPGPIAADMTTLMPQIVEMGRLTTARLLSFAYLTAPEPVVAALGLAPGARVQAAVRLRLSGDTPFSHLTTHVPEEIARSYSEADLATTPLFRLLERSGVRVGDAEQAVTATLATPTVAEVLGVAPGAPLLSLTRVVRDAEGRGIEHLAALYRPDLFRLEMRLHRAGAGDARYWEPVIDGAEVGDQA
ncbi:MAG: GntR family transcriptional regulator [Pseudomonadota bacterium]